MTANFDSLEYANILTEAGETPLQAAAHAKAMSNAMAAIATLAAKVDGQDSKIERATIGQDSKIDKLGSKMDVQTAELKSMIAALDAKVERTSKENTRWLIGTMISLGLLQSSMIAALALG